MNAKLNTLVKMIIVLSIIGATFGIPSTTFAASTCSCLVYVQNLTGLPATGDANFSAKDYATWLSQKGFGISYDAAPQRGDVLIMSPARAGNTAGHIAYIESASYNSTTKEWTIVLWDANFAWSRGVLKSTTHADCSNVKQVRWVTKDLTGLQFFRWSTCKPMKTVFGKDKTMLAQYFNNTSFTQPAAMLRCESPAIDRPWSSNSPSWKNLDNSSNYKVIGVGSDNFSVRWEGPFYINSGTYRLNGGVDDAVTIYLNGVKKFSTSSPKEYAVTTGVTSGQNLRIEYVEKGYSASYAFRW